MYNKLLEKCVVWAVLCAVWFGCFGVLLLLVLLSVVRVLAGVCWLVLPALCGG